MAGSNLGDTVEMVLMQGGTFEGGFTLTDELGQHLNSTWRGRLEVRNAQGDLLAAFAESGADGTLTINGFGRVLLSLPSSYSTTMEPTSDSLGLNSAVLQADIEVWRASAPNSRYKPQTPFRVFIRPEVTTA